MACEQMLAPHLRLSGVAMSVSVAARWILVGLLPVLFLVGPAQVMAQDVGRTDTAPPPQASLAAFAPNPSGIKTRLDFSFWDQSLAYFVFPMGRSLRQGMIRPEASLGTRQVYGHDSRYRMEGNRVAFEYLTPEIIAALTEYRLDLQQIASETDLTRLPRNEQLAFWFNLHNVALVEQIALAYPVSQPRTLRIGSERALIDEAQFIDIRGQKLSLRDIRTRIVYPNWRDARVIYGFWRGDIGGPSIQTRAFTGANLDTLLDETARDFVNSLRGTQKTGSRLDVSTLYDEARSFYFPAFGADLLAHFQEFADSTTESLIARTSEIDARISEPDIADLAKGENDPNHSFVWSDDRMRSTRINPAIARLLVERADKLEEIEKRGERRGTVTIYDIYVPGAEAAEIE